MAYTKQQFALVTNLMTHLWGPTTVRISGDESVAGQIRPREGGGVEFDFPERLIMIANHQVSKFTPSFEHDEWLIEARGMEPSRDAIEKK